MERDEENTYSMLEQIGDITNDSLSIACSKGQIDIVKLYFTGQRPNRSSQGGPFHKE